MGEFLVSQKLNRAVKEAQLVWRTELLSIFRL